MASPNPYQGCVPQQFWRTAVAEAGESDLFGGIWSPKFPLGMGTSFVTAGSCFAQHISKWLIRNGYNWLDSEPAPGNLDASEREANGYGVFSFRTGNIYTAALLRQWIEQSLSGAPTVDEVFEENGRYFDPLRPLIAANGFDDKVQLLAARQHTLDCIRTTVSKADVFVFTLGLTEAWQSTEGYVYPICPGTAKGEFNPQMVRFVNYGYEDTIADLTAAFDAIGAVNPSVKFLLTVSPVPLTATASDQHVLPATTYSKSVLRSTAGYLASVRDDVDYFPSFELIASPPIKGRYYAANKRSVTPEGVDFVMRHFAHALSASPETESVKSEQLPTTARSTPEEEDVLCEDALLEAWSGAPPASEKVNVCFIGDSHMGMLAESFSQRGIPHAGGGIMVGSSWTSNLLHLDKEEFFVPLEGPDARRRWRKTLSFFGRNPKDHKIIFSNIGQQTHRSVNYFTIWAKENSIKNLTNEIFNKYFLEENRSKLVILKRMIDDGYKVVIVTDPPSQFLVKNIRIDLFAMYEKLTEKIYKELGCTVFNVRDELGPDGFKEDYISEKYKAGKTGDWLHGSKLFYSEIASRLIDKYAVQAV